MPNEEIGQIKRLLEKLESSDSSSDGFNRTLRQAAKRNEVQGDLNQAIRARPNRFTITIDEEKSQSEN